METVFYIIVFIGICVSVCVIAIKKKKEAENDNAHHNPQPNANITQDEAAQLNQSSTKDLCIHLLRQINCEVIINEEDENRLEFSYQGWNFCIDTSDECPFINIWDFGWATADLDNLEEVSMMRRVVNDININSVETVLYTIDEENNRMIIHSKKHALLISNIPNTKGYLMSLFDDFFAIHHRFRDRLHDLQAQEEKK